jgi:CelD/BcsL family acetyltransferase involved in cellulose biosynthesis
MEIKLGTYDKISPDLRKRWLKLWTANDNAHPFNHPEWFAVAPVQPKDSSRVVVVASDNGQDLMFLSAETDGKKLSLLGSPYLEKSSILVDPVMSKEDWKEVINFLLRDYHQITFQETSQYLANTLHIKTSNAWRMSKLSSFSPFFEVGHPHISGKRRHEVRRYTRKLDKEHGPLAIDFMPLTVQLLEVMADIERRSRKPDKGRAEFEKQAYFDFLENAIYRYQGMCWIGLMLVSGNPVAHYAGIVYNRKMLGLHMAFDQRFSRYSPGSVLIFNLLPMLTKQHIDLFEFGRGQSVVKTRFSGEQVERQETFYFFKKNARGTAAILKTVLLWSGISIGRWIRARDLKTVNNYLDRLAIKR